jgi:hypothetical protein
MLSLYSHAGGEDVSLLLILDLDNRKDEWSASRPVAFYPWEWTSGTYYVGGWLGLRACVYAEARKILFASAGDRTPVVKYVAARHYMN